MYQLPELFAHHPMTFFIAETATTSAAGHSAMLLTIVGSFIGAMLSLLTSIYIEYQRRPKLSISIEEPPCNSVYPPGRPARKAKFLRVVLRNNPMPKWLKWLGRETATQCSGQIEFCHLDDGVALFARKMPIRWSNSDEPISMQSGADGQPRKLFDLTKYREGFRQDCHPGTPELIDIAARFDEEIECYGWSTEQYLPDKGWRNPDWKIDRGRYRVKVTVTSSGQSLSAEFNLENTANLADFRLI
ncbi:MAG TPA: hypothetical protein VGM64_08790 [Lacunisphaera sp.]